MYTRKQRLANICTHEEYWAQLVRPCITNLVVSTFGITRLEDSTDPHMNDIPLYLWDRLDPTVRGIIARNDAGILDTLRAIDATQAASTERGRFCWANSDTTCLLKMAARMFLERKTWIEAEFHMWPDGTIVAIFPQKRRDVGLMEAYRNGDMVLVSDRLIYNLPLATREQYAQVKAELEELRYIVSPANRHFEEV